jgi:DNA-directed RNA polymerase specialized sigma24 family protein
VGDEAAAAQAVRLGMTDLSRFDDETSVDDAHRSWAHHVYLRTQQLADGASAKHNSVGRLAPVDRACVALCLFGGHTYREVASLLDVPPRTVAELLTASLRDVERLADGGAVANA